MDVGFSSLGTFSRTFTGIVGETPSDYRVGHDPMVAPNCVQMMAMRPLGAIEPRPVSREVSSFGEASAEAAA
jgi:AraC-like DNA-binding protein